MYMCVCVRALTNTQLCKQLCDVFRVCALACVYVCVCVKLEPKRTLCVCLCFWLAGSVSRAVYWPRRRLGVCVCVCVCVRVVVLVMVPK